ncbi:MAG: hypothetical protein M1338_02035 [Patescibacteria group bacterium]|nr:hypothetical protein [Patescibacteria group bacterium]
MPAGQEPKAPEQYSQLPPTPPSITDTIKDSSQDPRKRKFEDFYLAQQKTFNPDDYYSNELENSGFTLEKITPKEKKNAEDFLASFQKRLPNKLKGDDFFSDKSYRDKNHKLQTIFPGETGYSFEDWGKTQWQIKTFLKELSPEELAVISRAVILSAEKFDRKYGIPWKSIKTVGRSGDKIVVTYLLEVPKSKKLTIDVIVIIDEKTGERTEFVTRKGY